MTIIPPAGKMSDHEGDANGVAHRLAQFARTRDPAALWPGLTEPARVAAGRELERVTRAVLAGDRTVVLDPGGAHDPYALAVAGHTGGVGPLVGYWMERGLVTARPAACAPFAAHLDHGRRRGARMEREALPAIDALLARGIVPVALKGFHTARAYFDDAGVRRMADVDLLVEPAQVAEAEAALRAAGFAPDGDAHRPYKRDWIGPGVDPRHFSVERWDARSRWILELHASLDRHHHPGAVATLDRERAATVALPVAGRPLRALGQPLLLLALACHASQELDGSRLLRLVELVQVIRVDRAAGRLDWDAFLEMARRTRSTRFAWPALALAESLAPGTVDPRVLAAGRAASTWAARHTVDRLTPAGGSLDARGVLRQLMWTRGAVAVLHRAVRNVWPAAIDRPGDVLTGWRVRVRRMRSGLMSFSAPDERG